jgi:alpha-1,6-mannosyltransferase
MARLPPGARLPGLGLGIGLCCLGVVALGDLRADLVAFIALFFAAFVAYLVAVWQALREPALTAGRRLWPLLALALAYRLLLLPAAPTLSDDLYRYVWEGRVLAAGLSPYRHAPDDPRLTPLRDDTIWPRVNNPSAPSPYPPLAQLGGLLGALLTPASPLGVKLVATAADLATIGALLLLLAATGRPVGRVLVYAWHPLVLLAFSHSGHNDALMAAPLVLALALVAAGRRGPAVPLLALAALAKVLPLLLLPLLPRRLGLAPTLLLVALVVVAWLPFLLLGGGAVGSIITYLGSWADNDSLHALLRLGLGEAGAKAVSLALVAGGVALLALHARLRARPLWWQLYVAFGLALALASTVHAWYLTWLLPPLAVHLEATAGRPWLGPLPALGWLLFSGLAALPYLTYDTHQWQLWISIVEYGPLYALLAVAALRRGPKAA